MENQEQILQAAVKGDAAAFRKLYDYACPVVEQECLRVLKNPFDAEDAAQEAFVRIYRKLDKVRDPEKFLPWCRTIAKHCALSLAGKRAKKSGRDDFCPPVSDDEQIGLDRLDDPDVSFRPEEQAQQEHLRAQLQEAVDALSPQRALCVALYQEGYSYPEIAQQLSIPLGTVKSNIHYGKEKLKRELKQIEKREHTPVHGFALVPASGAVQVRNEPRARAGAITARQSVPSARQEDLWEQVTKTLFPGTVAKVLPFWEKTLSVILAVLVIGGGLAFMAGFTGASVPENQPRQERSSQIRKVRSEKPAQNQTRSGRPAASQQTRLTRQTSGLSPVTAAPRPVQARQGAGEPVLNSGENPVLIREDPAAGTPETGQNRSYRQRFNDVVDEVSADIDRLAAAENRDEEQQIFWEALGQDSADIYALETEGAEAVRNVRDQLSGNLPR